MKMKITSVFLIVTLLLGCSVFCVNAANKPENIITVFVSDDISDVDEDALYNSIIVKTGNATVKRSNFVFTKINGSIMVDEKAKPGRKYFVEFELVPAEGITINENTEVEIELEGNCKVNSKVMVTTPEGLHPKCSIEIIAKGSVLQRIIGLIADVILKIRSYQIY